MNYAYVLKYAYLILLLQIYFIFIFIHRLEEVIPSRIVETSNIQMTFRGTGVANDPSISSLYIGDSFYMFLRYSGGKFNCTYVSHYSNTKSGR